MNVKNKLMKSLLSNFQCLPAVLVAAFLFLGLELAAAKERPNILFIFLDDFGWKIPAIWGRISTIPPT